MGGKSQRTWISISIRGRYHARQKAVSVSECCGYKRVLLRYRASRLRSTHKKNFRTAVVVRTRPFKSPTTTSLCESTLMDTSQHHHHHLRGLKPPDFLPFLASLPFVLSSALRLVCVPELGSTLKYESSRPCCLPTRAFLSFSAPDRIRCRMIWGTSRRVIDGKKCCPCVCVCVCVCLCARVYTGFMNMCV